MVRAVSMAINGNGLRNARLSLARTAELLISYPQSAEGKLDNQPAPEDLSSVIEHTPWGRAPDVVLQPAYYFFRGPHLNQSARVPYLHNN